MVFHQTRKSLILFSIILNFMNGETNIVESLLLRLLADKNKLLAVGIGERAKENGMHDAEDCGVCSNSERENYGGHHSEAGVLAHHSDCVAKVLRHALNERQALLIAIRFLRLLYAAEFAPGFKKRFLRIHSAANIFVGEQLQVSAKFRVKGFIQAPLSEQTAQARSKHAQGVHRQTPSAPSKRAITAAIRSQVSASLVSCLRPERVSE